MAWQIEYTRQAQRQLSKLDKAVARRILDFMDQHVAPQSDPRSIGKALAGRQFGAYWRYRVDDHRIVCDIQDGVLRVLVVGIGHRSQIYRPSH